MPPWGRPPGARLGRKMNNGWDRQSWEQYNERFEEVDDTDYESYHGVELDNRGYAPKRFVSDELRFTGIDMSSATSRARQWRTKNVYDEDTDPEYEDLNEIPSSSRIPPGMQLMLRTKEDDLVERALERIARARALGKTNVKLSQAEIDALERAERKNQRPEPPPIPKPIPKSSKKTAAQTRPKAQERKKSKGDKSSSNSPKVKAIEAARSGSNRSRSSTGPREGALVTYQIPSEDDYSPPGRYDSDGYFMPAPVRPGPPAGPASRTTSSHSLRPQQSRTPPVPPALQQYYVGRYSSNPDANYGRPGARPDPSDPDWEPRARSTSNLVSYPVDQLPYQTQTHRAPRFDPTDPRYASPVARRVISGPPATQGSPLGYRRSSDEAPEETTTDEDEDEGVQVDVETSEDGEVRVQTRRLAISEAPKRSATTTTKKGKRGR